MGSFLLLDFRRYGYELPCKTQRPGKIGIVAARLNRGLFFVNENMDSSYLTERNPAICEPANFQIV